MHSIKKQYKKEVVSISNKLPPALAEGFFVQRGVLFGFGSKTNDSTGTFLKLSAASAIVEEKLNQASHS